MKRPFNIHCKTLEDQKFDTISVLDSKFQLNCTNYQKLNTKEMQLQVRIYFLDGKMIKLKSGNNTSGIGMYVQYVSTIHLYSPSITA